MPESDVTIIIPTFNRAHLLPKAIESALSQTVACEVIVSDHGSTDHTAEVVGGYADKVIYLRRHNDYGPFLCWLDGLVHAKGRYVHFTFDDDWIADDFVERSLSIFRDDCAFVFTAVSIHDESGAVKPLYVDEFPTGIHPSRSMEELLMHMLLTVSPGCGLFRKEEALRALYVGKVPLAKNVYHGVGPDLLLYLLPLLEFDCFGFVNASLAHFRAHAGSITTGAQGASGSMSAMIASYDEVRNYYAILKYAKEHDLAKLARARMGNGSGLGKRIARGLRRRARFALGKLVSS